MQWISFFILLSCLFIQAPATQNSTLNQTEANVWSESTLSPADQKLDPESALEPSLCTRLNGVFTGILLTLLSLVGIVGNILSILTFYPTMPKNATSFILIVLAVFDNGVCFIWMVNGSIPYWCDLFSCVKYKRYELVIQSNYLWPIGSIFHMATTWTVVLVTIYRYIAVCHPHSVNKHCTLRKAKIQVIIITVFSIVFNIPRFLDAGLKIEDTPDGAVVVTVDHFTDLDVYKYFYDSALYYVAIFIVPFSILTVMSYKLAKTLAQTRLRREQMTRSKQEDNDLTRILVAIVLLFLICQTFNPVRRLLYAVVADKTTCGKFYYIFSNISSVAVVFNSCANFVVYCIFSRRFRKNLLRHVFHCSNRVEPISTISGSAAKPNTAS